MGRELRDDEWEVLRAAAMHWAETRPEDDPEAVQVRRVIGHLDPKFKQGDWVYPEEFGFSHARVLEDGLGRAYYPNHGRVESYRLRNNVWLYKVRFPGAENVGHDYIELAEHRLRLVVRKTRL